MPRPTGSTAQERIMLRANAIGKVKEPEENTARSRILSRAAEMGEVKPAEAAPQYAEQTPQTREPYSIHAFGAGDDTGAANLMEKAWQTGKAGVLSVVGALKELESQASPVTREQSMGQFSGFGDLGRAVSESRETGESIDAITNRLETERLQRREAQKKALQDKATELFEKSAMAQEQAKEGLSPVGGFMVDMGVTGIQMAGDALMNAVAPGSGLFMMGLRSYGQAANEARREGKSEEQQFVAGLKSAGIETLTEKMFGAFGKVYGKAGADELVEKLVTKLTSNKTGQALLTWIVNGAGEGVEEVTSDILNPLADRILQLDDGNGPVYSVDDAAQMGYDFLLGAAMGLVGGSVQAGRGVKQGKAQNAENAYYEDLQKNGLFYDASAEKAAKASEAMRRAMPREYTEMYRSAYARPLSYALDRKRYERDVQRNTAPEINTKAAESVEAVTRGETITGNQAAAIARDPVAVEVLEQRTGVKLDTDKPISQVKRDIAGLASREVTRETKRATPTSPAAQKRAERRVGGFLENGQTAYQEMSRTAEDAPSLYAGFSSVYNAGLSGIEADKAKGKYAAMLTPEQRYAAYNAGLEDARAQLAQENAEVASVTTTAGAGLADNEYSRGLIATKKDTAATLNAWGKKLGVRIEIVDQVLGGRANGQYIKEQNLIQIAANSDKPLLNVTAHEITHRMQDLSPAEYRKFRQAAVEYKMQENGADTEAEIVEKYMEAAEQEGVALTRDGVLDELAADFAGDMLDDADLFAKFSKENRTAAQKLLDSLKEFLNKVRGLFTGKYRDMAAQEAYGKDFAELEDIAKQWQAAFDAAEQQAEKAKTAAGEGDGAKYQIKQFPNGMKYVQADRQVLFGNDPKAWSEQLESYINGKIRNHEDVRLIAEDGDVLLLTSKSAGKLSSIYDNNGRTLDENAFERKANAAAHIDELIKVSERGGKTVLDFGGRHGDMAKDGWNYRTAFFMDFDGKYYRTRISVALGKDGSIVYNIGEMQERSTPQINGSSGNSGAQWGNASDTSIPADGENVKPQFSLKATDSTGRKLSEQQQEFFKDSKVRDAEGRLKTVYHGSSAQFTKFSADFMSTNGSSEGQGFYFTDLKAMAQGYEKNGGQLLEGYLDIKNPLSDSEVTLSNTEVKRLIKAIDPTGDDLVLNYDSRGGMGYPSRTWYNRAVNDTLRMTMETSESDSEILAELANGMGNPGAVLKAAREVLGYDGYIVEGKYDDATVYVAFDSSQFKNVDNLTPTSDPDIRFQMRGTKRLSEDLEDLRDTYIRKYGEMPAGENAERTVRLPKKTSDKESISQTVRTILEAKATPDDLTPTIEEMALRGEFSYEAYSDKNAIADATAEIKRVGWAQALTEWTSSVRKGNVSKKNTAMGWALYNNAANSGDTATALTVLNNMVEHQRSAAQALQATRILKKLSPETQLYQVQRSVENLQEEMNKRYGDKKSPKLKIDQELAERFMRAKNQTERDNALTDIYRDIGRQMPSRLIDKWNAWRYLAMLGNARTHVRNIVGNAGFAPVVALKNTIAIGIEAGTSRVTGGKLERSKTFAGGAEGKALRKAAAADFAKIQDAAMGGGKYSEFQNANKHIEEGRVIFQSKIPGLKQVSKGLEWARKANSVALDAEDMWFSKPHYAHAMAQYCKAHGITAEMITKGENIEKARQYAIKEAQKATYRDTNAFSQFASEIGRRSRQGNRTGVEKVASGIVEGILPFRKTPANILVRGVEYSPIGLMRGIKQAVFDVRTGKITGAEAIDTISAGLTGTALVGLGAFLAAQSLLRGHGGDDDDKNKFEELQGHQAYSLELPDGTSITLDWLAPECLPLFIGVNLWEQTNGGKTSLTLAELLEAISNVSEPLLEMSCLQSLNDVLDVVGYAKSDGLAALPKAMANAATSYLTQSLPTLLGQAERTGEDKRYTTYTDKNAFLTTDMQYTLGRASARIPGWDYKQIPFIDAWGRTEYTGKAAARAFNNFLNPAFVSEVNKSPMETELMRLYDATGESVFPSRAGKTITVSGERVNLTAEEYVKYAEKKGKGAYDRLTNLTKDAEYKKLTDAEKVQCVDLIYTFTDQMAKTSVSKYTPDSWVTKAAEAEKKGISVTDFVIAKTKAAPVEALKDRKGNSIPYSKGLLIMERLYAIPGLTSEQRRILFIDLGVSEKVAHYNKALVQQELNKMRKK